MATGDVNPKNIFKVVRLEMLTAVLNSLIVGAVAFGRALLLQKDFMLSAVVGLSMGLIAILAIATGVTLPLLSKKVGLDPAVLAGPITTSVVDVVGLIIYFKIAQMFIPALRF
jgi:magnesium transporter